jgi:glucosamine--fructose-6-phosphate aminotransferase (isomerizing)
MNSATLPSPEQTAMYREAHEAAAAVASQLERNEPAVAHLAARLRSKPPRFVVTSARGSSDHAATFAKYVFETQLGCATMSSSPSVSSVYATPLRLEGALYLAISQSGKSPDLVRQAQLAREAGAHVVALVNPRWPRQPTASCPCAPVPSSASPRPRVIFARFLPLSTLHRAGKTTPA